MYGGGKSGEGDKSKLRYVLKVINMKKALLISCFDWYDRRLSPIEELLKNEYDVTILLSDYDHVKKRKIQKQNQNCTYIHVYPYKRNISLGRIFSHIQFGQKVNSYIRKMQPDFIYLLVPPNNTAYYCTKYKKKVPQINYILDIIDLWPESMPIGRTENSFFGEKWKDYRDTSLRYADAIFTECDLYKQILGKVLSGKLVATNYLFKNQTEEERQLVRKKISEKENKQIAKSDKIVLGYVGSINSILDINKIEQIIVVLKKAGFDIECRIIGDGDHREQFLTMLRAVSKVEYFGALFDEKEKIDILSECDFGLNVMKENVSVGLTIKSIDYLSYGLPLINNIHGDTWNFVEKNPIGINVSDNLKELVDEIKTNSFSGKAIYSFYEENFTREKFQDKVELILESVRK